MKELTIIGGGLAGLSLGVFLRKKGVPVQLYETGTYPKHKVCGEFICGVKEEILAEMGIENILSDSLHHRTMKWWHQNELLLESALPITAWGLSRYKLDQDLAARFVNRGGQLHLQSTFPLDREEGPGLVYASGKNKAHRREARGPQWLGLKVHLTRPPAGLKGLEMHLGTQGYLGMCEVEDQRVNCCGLFRVRKELKGRRSQLLLSYLRANGLGSLAQRLEAQNRDEDSFSATAGFSLGAQEPVGSFCIGDAATLIPPFTGNGMSMALESSYLAGQALVAYAEGRASWSQASEQYQESCAKLFQSRLKKATLLHPALFHPLGRAALSCGVKSKLLPVHSLFKQLRTP